MNNPNQTKPVMKAILLPVAAFLAAASASIADWDPKLRGELAAKVVLLDDQSGEELARDHGIQPVEIADLLAIVNGVLANRKAVQIIHQVVDEDASDNPLTVLDFNVYQGGAAPVPPPVGLPISQLREAMLRYRTLRSEWQQDIKAYQDGLQKDVERFVAGIATAQTAVAARHDAILLERNGKDFNRSDIAGGVLAAAKTLGNKGLRILVMNTDAVDRPGHGKFRVSPFTPAELDPGIVIVWVNTSRVPDKSRLFDGLKNPVRHADSMREAMELVNELLEEDGAPPAQEEESNETPDTHP